MFVQWLIPEVQQTSRQNNKQDFLWSVCVFIKTESKWCCRTFLPLSPPPAYLSFFILSCSTFSHEYSERGFMASNEYSAQSLVVDSAEGIQQLLRGFLTQQEQSRVPLVWLRFETQCMQPWPRPDRYKHTWTAVTGARVRLIFPPGFQLKYV